MAATATVTAGTCRGKSGKSLWSLQRVVANRKGRMVLRQEDREQKKKGEEEGAQPSFALGGTVSSTGENSFFGVIWITMVSVVIKNMKIKLKMKTSVKRKSRQRESWDDVFVMIVIDQRRQKEKLINYDCYLSILI